MQNDKTLIDKIKNLILGAEPEVQPEPVKNELNPDERAELDNIISELRARVDEMQALIERFTATQSENEATIQAQNTEIENLKKQVKAVNIKPTEPAKSESKMSEAAKSILNKYSKYIN